MDLGGGLELLLLEVAAQAGVEVANGLQAMKGAYPAANFGSGGAGFGSMSKVNQ